MSILPYYALLYKVCPLNGRVPEPPLNRIIDGLAAEKIFSLPVAQSLKEVDDAYEKSCVVAGILHQLGAFYQSFY